MNSNIPHTIKYIILIYISTLLPQAQATYFEDLIPALSQPSHTSQPKTTLLYFSSNDCPTAQKLTPQLIHWYQTQKATDTEIVFVSNDPSEEDMRDNVYGNSMPWPCIKYNARTYSKIKKFWDGTTKLVAIDPYGNTIRENLQPDQIQEILVKNTSQNTSPMMEESSPNTQMKQLEQIAQMSLPNSQSLQALLKNGFGGINQALAMIEALK